MSNDPRVEQMRHIAWATAAFIEVFAVLYGAIYVLKLNMRDPVLIAIALAVLIAGGWATRRWINATITEDFLRRRLDRR